jgi:Cu2+-exporting ATPase
VIPADAIRDAGDACFHCGERVPGGVRYGLRIGEDWKAMCCAGCEAVASAILGRGLGDYYRLRESAGGAPQAGGVAEAEDPALYDDPAVQRGFVRSEGSSREALLLLEGIRCPACAWLNEQVIGALPGVLGVSVNAATQLATVRWDSAHARLSDVLRAVREIGYRASPFDPSRALSLQRAERRSALARICVAGLGAMQVMMYAVPAYLAGEGEMTADISLLMRWASFALTLPVVLYSAWPFFAGAWRDLRNGRLGMDVPVALGVAVAFGASVAATLRGAGEVYFDSVTMFVFLLLVGRYFEILARHRAGYALQHLARLAPEFANRLRDFPRSLESDRVAAAALRSGELVLVKPGETFPADGVVAQGLGVVSEALVSGEARPLAKSPGSAVIAGSSNLSSPLFVKVTRVGPDTVLSSILRLADRAAAEKPRLIRLADRTAAWFIASVIALAAVAGWFWAAQDPARALPAVVAVLVATCPCALSLSAPIALTVAVGEFARGGIVVVRSRAVEALARADDVVFDKTGTLTRGEPRLKEAVIRGGASRERCLALAAALEAASEHPIGKAFAAADAGRGLRVEEIRNFPGAGIEARIEGGRYRVGTLQFARQLFAGPAPEEQPGEDTIVWLGGESGLLASFRLGDELRREAEEALEVLHSLGVRTHLLSGDGGNAVREIARRLNIPVAEANAAPERKLQYVAELQRQGRIVAMLGDGINDAPVLAQADVSLAMSGGARLAQLRADAVIVSQDLRDLPRAIGHARLTLRVVRQNIAWAFAYNLLVLPLALAGALTPWAAALGMSASSLVVALNALRLERRSRRERPAAAAAARLAAT